MLSKRILDYGIYRTRWICPGSHLYPTDGWAYHDSHEELSSLDHKKFQVHLKKSKPPDFDLSSNKFWGAYKQWQSIRIQYSKRLLTYPTDRLPAIAAIAQTLQPYLGGYTAGLWNEVLHLELLWTSARARIAPRLTEYVSPTWSWPSLNCAVHNTAPLFEPDPTDQRHDDPTYERYTDPRSDEYDPDMNDRRYLWFPNAHGRFRVLDCAVATGPGLPLRRDRGLPARAARRRGPRPHGRVAALRRLPV